PARGAKNRLQPTRFRGLARSRIAGPGAAACWKGRPRGGPRHEDLEIREDAIPQPAAGDVVTRTIWLSIDPYMRGRLREQQTYAQPINPGDVMTGETVGEVIASANPDFTPGDIVVGARGWQTHSVTPG